MNRSSFLPVLFSLITVSAFASPIISYRAEIKPNVPAKSIEGTTTIYLNKEATSENISFPIYELNVTKVEINGKEVSHRTSAGKLIPSTP